MASITLPDLPKGKEFEEYISAIFQSGGNYSHLSKIALKGGMPPRVKFI
jgi:hypothetical protein